MKKYFLSLLLLFIIIIKASADEKKKIISKFQNIKNLSFNFEQNVNGKIEEGNCIIEYPKKIYCKYNKSNNKTLISNGTSLVIKTDIGSYYRYPLKNTPLNLILDKRFIINEIGNSKKKNFENKLINFTLKKNGLRLDIFFDRESFYITGWQTIDIYQNTNFTYISNIKINQNIDDETFKLPKLN
jgi:outer membrane lipoprotein-sorting protein